MSETQICTEVLKIGDLANPTRRQQLLHINELINDAYWINGHPDINGNYHKHRVGPQYTTRRIQSEDQLMHELSEEGLMAICNDESILGMLQDSATTPENPSDYTTGKYGKCAAVASIKPWAGKKVLLFEKARAQAKLVGTGDMEIGDVELQKAVKQQLVEQKQESCAWEWEVSTCATADSARYRGQGLMSKCVDALIDHLRLLQKQMRESGDPRGSQPINLWVTALVGSPNPAYWLRRGFENEGEPDKAPAGMWTSTSDFEVQTMKRVLL